MIGLSTSLARNTSIYHQHAQKDVANLSSVHRLVSDRCPFIGLGHILRKSSSTILLVLSRLPHSYIHPWLKGSHFRSGASRILNRLGTSSFWSSESSVETSRSCGSQSLEFHQATSSRLRRSSSKVQADGC